MNTDGQDREAVKHAQKTGAVLTVLSWFLILLGLYAFLGAAPGSRSASFSALLHLLVGGAFFGLCLWCRSEPIQATCYAALVIGMALLIEFVAFPANTTLRIAKGVMLLALAISGHHAYQYHRLTRQEPDTADPRSKGTANES